MLLNLLGLHWQLAKAISETEIDHIIFIVQFVFGLKIAFNNEYLNNILKKKPLKLKNGFIISIFFCGVC